MTRGRDLAAIVLMLAGMALIPAGDAFNKAALGASGHAPATLAWWRVAIGGALVVPLALVLARDRRPRPAFLRAALLRGTLFAGGIVCITTAMRTVPLADTFGAFFIAPFVALFLARGLLGEAVRPRDWAAVALGFAGVLLVVRPGFGMSPGILWAVAAGCCYGGYITATRATAGLAQPLSHLAGQLAVAALVLLPLALRDPVSIRPQVPLLLLGSGASSGVGNLLAITALSLGTTAYLAPLIYSQIVVAALLSVAVFGDPVAPLAGLGLVLIVVTGLSRVLPGRRPARN